MDISNNPNQHLEGKLPSIDTIGNSLDMPNTETIDQNIDALAPVEVLVNPPTTEFLKPEDTIEQTDTEPQVQQNTPVVEAERIPVTQTVNPPITVPIKTAQPISGAQGENYIDQIFNASAKDLDPASLTDQLNDLQETVNTNK